MKQDELKEAAKKYAVEKRYKKNLSNREFDLAQKDFIAGAKWMEEKMYSKEDVLKAGEIGEINHHDYKHLASLLDKAKQINNQKK